MNYETAKQEVINDGKLNEKPGRDCINFLFNFPTYSFLHIG